jgi:phosphodiesterase/alkaline phosphatase D-like protein
MIVNGRVQVNPGTACGPDYAPSGQQTTLVALRRMLQAAAEGAQSFPKPAFACGVGDQVYVEGDYHSYGEYGHHHPMSAWTVEEKPRPRVGLADLPRFLDTCYRGHWSFTTFERALQVCPSLMIWDDHDIRDGWGSQGGTSTCTATRTSRRSGRRSSSTSSGAVRARGTTTSPASTRRSGSRLPWPAYRPS